MGISPYLFVRGSYLVFWCLAALYSAVYSYVLGQPRIADLTVEDPAEAFEDLRDRCDLRMLLGEDEFIKEGWGEEGEGHSVGGPVRGNGRGKGKAKAKVGKMGPPVDKAWLERWRMRLKIASVSFLSPFQREKYWINADCADALQ